MSENEQFPVQMDTHPHKGRLDDIDLELVEIDGRNPELEAILKSERARLLAPSLKGILGIDLDIEMPQEDYLADFNVSSIDRIADYKEVLKTASSDN